MIANGIANGQEAAGPQVVPKLLSKPRSDRQPILSLVDREFLKSVGNIPRGMWEPMSYLYSEADKSLARIDVMEIPAELEAVKESAIKQWHQAIAWLDELLMQSQSVEALRSWQLMGGLQGSNVDQRRPSVNVQMPEFQQPQPPGQGGSKRGLRLRE